MRFRFIEDRRADYPVTTMCGVLGVSPAGYYAWRWPKSETRRREVAVGLECNRGRFPTDAARAAEEQPPYGPSSLPN